MRTKTYNKGASDERSVILRHVRRLSKTSQVLALIDWIESRRSRYDPKPRGVGK